MMTIRRNPKGEFVSQNAVLGTWLGVMLSQVFRNPLEEMLSHAAIWCDRQHAAVLRLMAEALESGCSNDGWFAERRKSCGRWIARRSVLLDAREKLKNLR